MDAFWLPFIANRQFKGNPRLMASAKGMYHTAVDGKQVLDGTDGLWCVNAGHRREPIMALGVWERGLRHIILVYWRI
jgi:beta-alanine--pyruvate transaminase